MTKVPIFHVEIPGARSAHTADEAARALVRRVVQGVGLGVGSFLVFYGLFQWALRDASDRAEVMAVMLIVAVLLVLLWTAAADAVTIQMAAARAGAWRSGVRAELVSLTPIRHWGVIAGLHAGIQARVWRWTTRTVGARAAVSVYGALTYVLVIAPLLQTESVIARAVMVGSVMAVGVIWPIEPLKRAPMFAAVALRSAIRPPRWMAVMPTMLREGLLFLRFQIALLFLTLVLAIILRLGALLLVAILFSDVVGIGTLALALGIVRVIMRVNTEGALSVLYQVWPEDPRDRWWGSDD